MTSRNLYSRVAEHRGRGCRTGHLLSRPPHSAVRAHTEQRDVLISDSDFKVLASTSGVSDLCILESLYIFKQRPSLNLAFSSYPLEIVNR